MFTAPSLKADRSGTRDGQDISPVNKFSFQHDDHCAEANYDLTDYRGGVSILCNIDLVEI